MSTNQKFDKKNILKILKKETQIEDFLRFIYENDLRKESYILIKHLFMKMKKK
jgi:hypothetical protein